MKKVFALFAVVLALAVGALAGSSTASANPKPGDSCLFYVDQVNADQFALYPTYREAIRAANKNGWTYIGTETIC